MHKAGLKLEFFAEICTLVSFIQFFYVHWGLLKKNDKQNQ